MPFLDGQSGLNDSASHENKNIFDDTDERSNIDKVSSALGITKDFSRMGSYISMRSRLSAAGHKTAVSRQPSSRSRRVSHRSINTMDFENGLNNLKRDLEARNMISEKTSKFTTSSDERLLETPVPEPTPEQKIGEIFYVKFGTKFAGFKDFLLALAVDADFDIK